MWSVLWLLPFLGGCLSSTSTRTEKIPLCCPEGEYLQIQQDTKTWSNFGDHFETVCVPIEGSDSVDDIVYSGFQTVSFERETSIERNKPPPTIQITTRVEALDEVKRPMCTQGLITAKVPSTYNVSSPKWLSSISGDWRVGPGRRVENGVEFDKLYRVKEDFSLLDVCGVGFTDSYAKTLCKDIGFATGQARYFERPPSEVGKPSMRIANVCKRYDLTNCKHLGGRRDSKRFYTDCMHDGYGRFAEQQNTTGGLFCTGIEFNLDTEHTCLTLQVIQKDSCKCKDAKECTAKDVKYDEKFNEVMVDPKKHQCEIETSSMTTCGDIETKYENDKTKYVSEQACENEKGVENTSDDNDYDSYSYDYSYTVDEEEEKEEEDEEVEEAGSQLIAVTCDSCYSKVLCSFLRNSFLYGSTNAKYWYKGRTAYISAFITSALYVQNMEHEEEATLYDSSQNQSEDSDCESSGDYDDCDEDYDTYNIRLSITYQQYKELVEYYILEVFNILDTNEDGDLSKEENFSNLISNINVLLKLLRKLFMISDTNRDGIVGFEDVLTPASNDLYSDEDESDDDVDANSIEGVTGTNPKSLPDPVQKLIQKLDTNGDEKLHWSEVENFVRSVFEFLNFDDDNTCHVTLSDLENKFEKLVPAKFLLVLKSVIGFYKPVVEHINLLMIQATDSDNNGEMSFYELKEWSDKTNIEKFFKMYFVLPAPFWTEHFGSLLNAPDIEEAWDSLDKMNEDPAFAKSGGSCFKN